MTVKRLILTVFVFILALAWGLPNEDKRAISSSTSPLLSSPTSTNSRPKFSIHSVKEAAKHPEVVKPITNGNNLDGASSNLAPGVSPRAVPHDFFYSWMVVCPVFSQIRETNQDPNAYPEIYGTRPVISNYASIVGARTAINTHLRRCRHCVCDDVDGGTMHPNPGQPFGATQEYEACSNYIVVRRCEGWWDCRCSIKMNQRDMDPSISIAEYQDALNNLPFAVKRTRPNYGWKYGHNDVMKWQYDTAYPPSSWFDSANHRELAPGTNEPYYLEGPNEGLIRAGPSDQTLRSGPQLWGSGFSKAKRDLTGEGREPDEKEG